MVLFFSMSCSHHHECGGCRFQHIDYEIQLQQKQTLIDQIFAPFPVEPIIPCSHPWQYRNKMEFSFSQNKAGEQFLGLILRASRGKVFNLRECLITSPWFAKTVQNVKAWWEKSHLRAYHFHKGEGSLRTLTLREGKRTGERMVMLTLSSNPRFALSRQEIDSFKAAINDPNVSIFLRLQQCLKGSATQFYEIHLSGSDHIREEIYIEGKKLIFKISPTSFFQPNTLQAEVLYSKALEMIEPKGHIFDLYAGTATIGMILAQKAQKVVAVELSPYAVFDAQESAVLNQIDNLEVVCGDVGKVLAQITTTPDLVVVDPPRAGLDFNALEQIARLKSPQILYISCNPKSQSDNMHALCEYRPVKIQPVDQFPHTPHVENIVLLSRV